MRNARAIVEFRHAHLLEMPLAPTRARRFFFSDPAYGGTEYAK
jgi:hypothetical protein